MFSSSVASASELPPSPQPWDWWEGTEKSVILRQKHVLSSRTKIPRLIMDSEQKGEITNKICQQHDS